MQETKVITIPYPGSIGPRGGIMGPILSKHRETLRGIELLLHDGCTVVEHVGDKQFPLNLSNFTVDHSGATVKPTELAKVETVVEEPVKEAAPVVEDVKPIEKPVEHTKPQYDGKKNKNNRNNRQVHDDVEVK